MKASWKSVVVAVVAMVISGSMGGCSKEEVPAPKTIPYSVGHKMVLMNDYNAGFEVTIKGPAADLTAVLINPKGVEVCSRFISENEMEDNSHVFKWWMLQPQVGKWILVVKKSWDGELVWREEFMLSLEQLTVEDVKFDLRPVKETPVGIVGYRLKGMTINLCKSGDLPVEFNSVSAVIDGENCCPVQIDSGWTMTNQRHTIVVSFLFPPTAKMRARDGKRHRFSSEAVFDLGWKDTVKGKLCYGDAKYVEFETKLEVPENGTTKQL